MLQYFSCKNRREFWSVIYTLFFRKKKSGKLKWTATSSIAISRIFCLVSITNCSNPSKSWNTVFQKMSFWRENSKLKNHGKIHIKKKKTLRKSGKNQKKKSGKIKKIEFSRQKLNNVNNAILTQSYLNIAISRFFCYIIHTFYVFWASGGLILSERNLLTSSKHIRYVQLSSPEYIEEVKKVKLQF